MSHDIDIRVLPRVARALGLTEGQTWTFGLTAALTLSLSFYGLAPALSPDTIQQVLAMPAQAAVVPPPAASATAVIGEPQPAPAPAPDALSAPAAIFRPPPAASEPTEPPTAAPPIQVETPTKAVYGEETLLSDFGQLPAGVVSLGGGRRAVALAGEAGGPDEIAVLGPEGEHESRRAISIEGEDFTGIAGLVLGPDGSIVAVASTPAAVISTDVESGVSEVLAIVPDLPQCGLPLLVADCEPGAVDNLPRLVDLAWAADGSLLVTDAGQATIWRIVPGAELAVPWHQAMEYGTDSGLGGIEVAPDGTVLFAVGSVITETLDGALYRMVFNEDGTARDRTALTIFASDVPLGVALGDSGSIYVTLVASSTLAVLNADGTLRSRLPESPQHVVAPRHVAFEGQSILVTSHEETDGAHALVSIAVDEGPSPSHQPAQEGNSA